MLRILSVSELGCDYTEQNQLLIAEQILKVKKFL